MKKVALTSYKLPYLYQRSGHYYYRRAIPPELRPLADGRREFKKSLRARNITEAIDRYGPAHTDIEAKFAQLRQGKPLTEYVAPPLSEIRNIAESLDVPYKSADQLTQSKDPAGLWKRLLKWQEEGKPDGPSFDAIFGTVPDTTTMNDVLDFYEKHTEDKLLGLSEREISKKRTPVQLAVRRFTEFAGEGRDIKAISRAVALDYRSHLVAQMKSGLIKGNTVNKQLTHLRKIMSFYIEHNLPEMANPFSKVSVKEDQNSRLPYTVKFIKERWLTGDPFLELNPEARGILFAMIDTGCGGKEICGIAPEEIKLEDKIPHIIIQPNKFRKLKTGHRGRTIPLVGHSLKAFEDNPDGFPRYRGSPGADNLSNTLMKFLRSRNLLETPKHSIYGIRHMFMDRMRAHSFPDELQNYLMGHKHPTMGARYGAGYTLDQKQRHLKKLIKDLN